MSLKWLIINVVNRHVVDGLMLSKPLHNLSIRTDWTIECHFKWSKKHRKLRGDNTENSQYITKNADCIGLRSVEIMKRKSGLKNKKWPLNGSKRTGNDVEGEKKRKSNRPRYGGFTLHKNEIKTMPNESNGTVGKWMAEKFYGYVQLIELRAAKMKCVNGGKWVTAAPNW